MVRVGEDISEHLDIVPAEFFVHRHIYGKWACRCCQCLAQDAVVPQIIDGGIPAAGLIAHTLISRSSSTICRTTARRRSTRAPACTRRARRWRSGLGAQARVLHADETPVAMLDPGGGKTKRAYVRAYARGAFDPLPGVVYGFCLGRGAQYPIAFLQGSDGFDAIHLGTVRWYGMNTRPTTTSSRRSLIVSPLAVLPTRGATSTNWASPMPVTWRPKRCTASRRSTALRLGSQNWPARSACACARR